MSDQLYPLVKARATMLLTQPFFGQLALRLTLKTMTPEITYAAFTSRGLQPTMATDGTSIYFDTAFVESLDSSGMQTVLAHEVMHCAFEHMGRIEGRNADLWNRACDHAVNLILKDSGFAQVGEWLCDPKFQGMSAEQIYALLLEDASPNNPAPAMCSLMPGDGDEAQVQENAIEWQIAVTQSAAAARMAGKLPSHLERFVGELLKPKVNWREVLRNFVTSRARDEYSWARPNRMYLSLGYYAPGLYNEQMDALAVAIDTSGSISQPILDAFAGEISGIRDSTAPKTTKVIYCDSEVNHVDDFERYDELHVKPHGGGGTDFRPPFVMLDKGGVTPACFIYLTDGYGPFPEVPPPYPVLWCMTTNVEPPWGEHVRIEV